jgi:hypothetical protein
LAVILYHHLSFCHLSGQFEKNPLLETRMAVLLVRTDDLFQAIHVNNASELSHKTQKAFIRIIRYPRRLFFAASRSALANKGLRGVENQIRIPAGWRLLRHCVALWLFKTADYLQEVRCVRIQPATSRSRFDSLLCAQKIPTFSGCVWSL